MTADTIITDGRANAELDPKANWPQTHLRAETMDKLVDLVWAHFGDLLKDKFAESDKGMADTPPDVVNVDDVVAEAESYACLKHNCSDTLEVDCRFVQDLIAAVKQLEKEVVKAENLMNKFARQVEDAQFANAKLQKRVAELEEDCKRYEEEHKIVWGEVGERDERIAELEGAIKHVLPQIDAAVADWKRADDIDSHVLHNAISPQPPERQCPKCKKWLTAAKIEADGGIHTCKGGGDGG